MIAQKLMTNPIGFGRIQNELNSEKKAIQQVSGKFQHERSVLESQNQAIIRILQRLHSLEETIDYLLLLEQKITGSLSDVSPANQKLNARYQEELQFRTTEIHQEIDAIERDIAILKDASKVSLHEVNELSKHLSAIIDVAQKIFENNKKRQIGFMH